MTSSLSGLQIAVLSAYGVGMAGGQLLFKSAALRLPAQSGFAERLLSLAHNAYFLAALVAYIGLALVWLWVLTFTPLSRAYLFVALPFALVPLAATLVFGEPLSGRFLLGAVLIVCGLILVVT